MNDPWKEIEEAGIYDGRGKKNRYTCNECEGSIVTEDVDKGVTPAFIGCRAAEGCEGTMGSAFYHEDPDTPPDGEWYRPPRERLETMSEEEREHVMKGGLVLRKVTGEDW